MRLRVFLLVIADVLSAAYAAVPATNPSAAADAPLNFNAVRSAIADLGSTFGARYAQSADFLLQLDRLEQTADLPSAERERQFRALQREALLANPLLDFDRVLIVRRK